MTRELVLMLATAGFVEPQGWPMGTIGDSQEWHYDKPASDPLLADFLSGDVSGNGQ